MTPDPFRIEGPACISVSGGRTSGYMLWRILQAHGGKLPDDVRPIFSNTGKEVEATLRFLDDCARQWNTKINWLEYQDHDEKSKRWREVTFDTASRNGEPFAAMIERERYLPNPVHRLCTKNLKILPMLYYMASLGYEEGDFDQYIGIRADEQHRLAKRAEYVYMPLANAGVVSADVGVFWSAQAFDLGLPLLESGKTINGNCDLCFLKGADQLLSVIRSEPDRAIWWMAQEKKIINNGRYVNFRSDRPSYAEMHRMATQHGELFPFDDEPLQDCMCVD